MSFSDLAGQVFDRCRDTFGETVEYRPAVGSPQEITAVFESTTTIIDAGVPVQSRQPNLGLKVSDLEAYPKQGDRVIVRAVEYRVAQVEEESEGWVQLLLHKV